MPKALAVCLVALGFAASGPSCTPSNKAGQWQSSQSPQRSKSMGAAQGAKTTAAANWRTASIASSQSGAHDTARTSVAERAQSTAGVQDARTTDTRVVAAPSAQNIQAGDASGGQSAPSRREPRARRDEGDGWGWIGLLGLLGLAGLLRKRDYQNRPPATGSTRFDRRVRIYDAHA